MRARRRALVVALLLGAAAGAIGAALALLPATVLTPVNRIADLAVHVAALDAAPSLGFGHPAFEDAPNPQLGIVTLDDASYKKMGFPLPHSDYARLLHALRASGAKTVAFDIEFLDASKDPEQDGAFASALRAMPSVLAFPVGTTSTGRIGEQPPVPLLAAAARATGFLTIDEPGGYAIGQPVEIDTSGAGEHSGERLPSLAAAAAGVFRGAPATRGVPLDDGRMLLLPPKLAHHQDLATQSDVLTQSFAGRGTLPFADALTAKPADLRAFANGALIFVGATAQGLGDFVTTAGRGSLPGLFVNARLADQLLRGFYLRAAPRWLDVLLAFAFALTIAWGFGRMRTGVAIAAAAAAIGLYAYLNLWLFAVHLYWLDLVHVALAMLLATTFVALYRTIDEGAQRRMVTNLFGMHVSPAIVSDILERDDPRGALALRGKRVTATIFYSDIRGFTAMSETMTPEQIYDQLNEYFDAMCAVVFEYGGYVDKFIGDCVMAVFSAPYQTPDDARNAVKSALKQQRRVLELCERWKAEGKPTFTVGMGINTGEVVMGNLGASSRMNYTVIGDDVNVAARLYNVAKGGEIIVSESTYAQCRDIVEADTLEPVAVKGKSRPIAVYRVRALRGDAP